MRLVNFVLALSGAAGVVSAFQNVNTGNNLDVVERDALDASSHFRRDVSSLDAQPEARAVEASKDKDKNKNKNKDTTKDTTKDATKDATKDTTKDNKDKSTDTTTTSEKAAAPTATTSTAKAGSPTTASTAAAGSTEAAAASCPIKRSRVMPRALFETSSKPLGKGRVWEVQENEYRLAPKTDFDDKIAVVDVSGCSAVFFFNKDGLPSTFHILCGREAEDGKAAAELVKKTSGAEPVSVTVAAESDARFKTLSDEIKKVFPSVPVKSETYPTADYKAGQRWRFDIEVPGTEITRTQYKSDCPRQAQKF